MEKLAWHQKLLLKKDIQETCQVFHQLGYPSVTEADLLHYLVAYRWKKMPKLSLKKCRQDLAQVQPNDFFDYQQIVAQTSEKSLADWHDLEDLL